MRSSFLNCSKGGVEPHGHVAAADIEAHTGDADLPLIGDDAADGLGIAEMAIGADDATDNIAHRHAVAQLGIVSWTNGPIECLLYPGLPCYRQEMMYAEILAIGPFRHDLVPFYEYPETFYSKTLPGTCIVTHLFGISEGTSLSCEFARFLGIDDAWDFNQHKIEPAKIDMEGLRVFLRTLSAWEEDHSRHFEALVAFVKAGYDLYFLPNG